MYKDYDNIFNWWKKANNHMSNAEPRVKQLLAKGPNGQTPEEIRWLENLWRIYPRDTSKLFDGHTSTFVDPDSANLSDSFDYSDPEIAEKIRPEWMQNLDNWMARRIELYPSPIITNQFINTCKSAGFIPDFFMGTQTTAHGIIERMFFIMDKGDGDYDRFREDWEKIVKQHIAHPHSLHDVWYPGFADSAIYSKISNNSLPDWMDQALIDRLGKGLMVNSGRMAEYAFQRRDVITKKLEEHFGLFEPFSRFDLLAISPVEMEKSYHIQHWLRSSLSSERWKRFIADLLENGNRGKYFEMIAKASGLYHYGRDVINDHVGRLTFLREAPIEWENAVIKWIHEHIERIKMILKENVAKYGESALENIDKDDVSYNIPVDPSWFKTLLKREIIKLKGLV